MNVQAPMEVEAVDCTPEELERARQAVHKVRPSLKIMYNQVLDNIGSCGLAFRKPQPADHTAAPAAAAIPSAAPPDELLQHGILTDSFGVRYDTLGHPQGLAGIMEEFNVSENCLAHTGFEPNMKQLSGTIPNEWESWRIFVVGPSVHHP